MKNLIKLVFLICSGLLALVSLNAQKEDLQWVIGYWSNGNPEYSVVFMDFSSGNLKLSWEYNLRFEMSETAANICDQRGEPLIWTNGMQIMGMGGRMIADTISYHPSNYYWNYYYSEYYEMPSGFSEPYSTLILPWPGYSNEYLVISHSAGIHPDGYFQVNRWLGSRVALNPDTSFTVMYKDSLIWEKHQWYN